jgi:16S rRNA (guanine527-N7)-methyltransferase
LPDRDKPNPHRAAPEFAAGLAALEPTPEFSRLCAGFGLVLEPAEVERLGRYLALLLETSRSHNLTAVREQAEAWVRHIFDSLTLVPVLAELPEGSRVIDVGSGGGLPGVPLAIAMPRLKFTLLEATGKKAEFLRHVASPAGVRLANVEVYAARAEQAGREPGRRDSYDAAVARAVGPMAVIAELATPLVRPGGLVVLVKGEKADEELAAAKQALHLLHATHAGTIQTPTGRLVVLEKQRATPKMYPRRDGEPKRAPLGRALS